MTGMISNVEGTYYVRCNLIRTLRVHKDLRMELWYVSVDFDDHNEGEYYENSFTLGAFPDKRIAIAHAECIAKLI